MTATNLKLAQSNGNLVKAGKVLLLVLSILLLAYLAFFCFVAVHEWAGHILGDEIVDARHGTTLSRLEVIVQFFSVKLQDGQWSIALVPFRIGGKVVSAGTADPFMLTDGEFGFGNFMGSGITTLISLVTLVVLNVRKKLPRFPWFAGFFSLWSVIFDQIFETFTKPADFINGAVRMGADPLLFKITVIGLVLLQGWLLIRLVVRHLQARRAAVSSV